MDDRRKDSTFASIIIDDGRMQLSRGGEEAVDIEQQDISHR
jgi:hypothetical protein